MTGSTIAESSTWIESASCFYLSWISFLAWCRNKSNILTRDNVQKYSSLQAPQSDFTRAYENLRGENLTTAGPYTINIVFNSLVCVTQVLVQRTADNRNTSNIVQIEVTYGTSNRTELKASDGTIVTLRSPENDPTITEKSLRCNIQGIDVKVLKTADKDKPSFTRLMVIGCFTPSSWIVFRISRL